MRNLALALIAATSLAGSALAQISPQATQQLDLLTQQQLERQRAVALENQLSTLEARGQAEQRLREVQAILPAPYVYRPGEMSKATATPGYATIPDAVLAASNARVREALQSKR